MALNHAYCSCRGVLVEARGEPYAVVACWCRECQRRTGSALGVGAYYETGALRITGATTRYTRAAPEGRQLHRYFCPVCGTTVYWKTDLHPDGVAVALGAFEEHDFLRPSRSVWNASRPPWFHLDDTIPAHVEGSRSPLCSGG